MCVGEGRVMVMVVCVGWYMGVLMRFVWRSPGVGMGVLGDGACLAVWVAGSESFGQVGIAYM